MAEFINLALEHFARLPLCRSGRQFDLRYPALAFAFPYPRVSPRSGQSSIGFKGWCRQARAACIDWATAGTVSSDRLGVSRNRRGLRMCGHRCNVRWRHREGSLQLGDCR